MKIDEQTYYEMLNTGINVPYEIGGLLGGTDGVISTYCIDMGVAHGKTCYYPDVEYLNNILEKWTHKGVSLYGFFHTHILGRSELSPGDEEYALSVLKAMPQGIRSLLFPIVIPGAEMVLYRGDLVDNEITFSHEEVILVNIKKENYYGKI